MARLTQVFIVHADEDVCENGGHFWQSPALYRLWGDVDNFFSCPLSTNLIRRAVKSVNLSIQGTAHESLSGLGVVQKPVGQAYFCRIWTCKETPTSCHKQVVPNFQRHDALHTDVDSLNKFAFLPIKHIQMCSIIAACQISWVESILKCPNIPPLSGNHYVVEGLVPKIISDQKKWVITWGEVLIYNSC